MLDGHLQLVRGAFTLNAQVRVEGRGITTICGRSGAGKTTLLRCIAGLDRDARGRLCVGDSVWLDSAGKVSLSPEERAVGMVSQDAHLFAHLNVLANLNYGLKRIRGRPRQVQFEAVVETLSLNNMLNRSVDGLSGGERRRVAIGRALLSSPQLLLLDEPVSALDGAGRREVLDGIQAALEALAIPCLYVSHDLHEAARLADHMLWMEAGRVVASGPIAKVLCDPRLPFAQATDAAAVVDATVEEYDPTVQLSRLRFSGGELWVAADAVSVGTQVRVQIAARDVSLALEKPLNTSVLNVIDCQVQDVSVAEDSPAHALVRLSAGDITLLGRITRKSVVDLDVKAGRRIWAMVKSVAILN